MRALLFTLLAASLCSRAGQAPLVVGPLRYSGMCDASGAVAVTSNLFVVASDEDNILRLYRSGQDGAPLKTFDCNAFLELRGKSLEADLEGGARIGNRAYWIGSHGRNKDGKPRPNRCRLFATDIKLEGDQVTLTPVGKPCKTLVDELISDSRFDQFHFAEAVRRAPKEKGALNIEGLSATPAGQLFIGFRNPIPEGKALLIPLLNPNQVIERKPAKFAPAIALDLGGLGIRDIALHDGLYVIIAGSYHGGGEFRFYRWAGPGNAPDLLPIDHIEDYHPEAIIIYPERGLRDIQILSDDGTRMIDGCPCKELPEPARRMFRSFRVVQ